MDKSENYGIGLEKVFSESFGRNDAKNLVFGVYNVCFLPAVNLQLATNARLRPLMDGIWNLPVYNVLGLIFMRLKEILGPRGNHLPYILLHPQMNEPWRTTPYARKGDNGAMKYVTELSIKSFLENDKQAAAPDCSVNHNTPAIIFSIGGYAGNQFHDFTEILLPLFLTSHHFYREVQFLITNANSYWVKKFGIHCYQKVTVGLKHHKDLGVDPMKSPIGYSMKDFADFLRLSYSLERSSAIKMDEEFLKKNDKKKPRLLILSRKRTRRFTNEEEIVTATSSDFTHIVNSCDVMVAVHGAGCTNLLFLPSNFGKHIYGEPAEAMNLRYLEYKIRVEKSRDPHSFAEQGWSAVKSVFLDQQNVNLHIGRFKGTLIEALY
ncbi:hypothetical protein MKX01_034870 [Papaver californicum]|nr:hypothetical protein MKX01_034870 [Papaver californicum]